MFLERKQIKNVLGKNLPPEEALPLVSSGSLYLMVSCVCRQR